jgi:hypothetical protein
VPKLAKLYRAFISEVVAVLDGNPVCDEVNIVGDDAWGVFDARTKDQLDRVVETTGQVSSLIDVLNDKLETRNYDPFYVGIGLDWGRALMIKTGFSGSGINDVVYVDNVVNSAAKLCSEGQEDLGYGVRRPRVMAGSYFVSNIASEKYRSFFTYDVNLGCYCTSINNTAMEQWR